MSQFVNPIEEPLTPVLSDIKSWPIYQVSLEKKKFLQQIVDKTKKQILLKYNTYQTLNKELKNILYQEQNRLRKNPWKSDTKEEKQFWENIKKQLIDIDTNSNETQKEENNFLVLDKVLWFYANQMVANFKPKTYRFAQKIVPFVVSKLTHSFPKGLFVSSKTFLKKSKIVGNFDLIRELAKTHTLVVVPTHFSNMDSPIVGYSVSSIGLPAMTYGAGINLFTISFLAKWMNNLGAYKIDRRRKTMAYLEMLKNYSTTALTNNVNTLFFPGGTRSRKGELEKNIKMGLLSTTIEAQRINIEENPEEYKKIALIPVVLNYHTVMEADSLISDYLNRTGRELYIEEKQISFFRLSSLLSKLIVSNPSYTVSYGDPIDVFGNRIDKNGDSYNHLNQKVDISDYFKINNQIIENSQRERVYTKDLSETIVKKFHQNNVVISSHLVAMIAFHILKKRFEQLDLYELLRLSKEDTRINCDYFIEKLDYIKQKVFDLNKKGDLLISKELTYSNEDILKHALSHMGAIHSRRPLRINKKKQYLYSNNLKTLYYYSNRFSGYKLEQYV